MDSQIDLINKCRGGDRDAFRLLVKAYHRLVFSVALKLLGDEDRAKDIVQETFIRVWQKLDSYDDNAKFSTWIYTIASRLCLDELDKMRRTQPMPEDAEVLDSYTSDQGAHSQLENKQWVAIVRTLANELSPKQRLVFTLSQLEGLQNDEVMQITGMDADKIKSNLYVARQTIRERLIKLGYGK